ncbi:hypothetical protein [Francisella adeliensis]|nr:hypothetical protein [Francisella adeliensis]MBK2096519.1 hypothetical protein [Francisella adeliensis]QIW14701.1 hypothetical protein FZC44_09310 [Francisella adeliensis]
MLISIFAINKLHLTYRTFIKSLPLRYRLKYRFLTKKLVVENYLDESNEAAIKIRLIDKSIICSININYLSKEKFTYKEIRKFLKKFSKGRINNILFKIDIATYEKDLEESFFQECLELFRVLKKYFSHKLYSNFMFTYDKATQGAMAWEKLCKINEYPMYWDNVLPSDLFFKDLFNMDNTCNSLLKESLTPKEIIDLHCFIGKLLEVSNKLHVLNKNPYCIKFKGFYLLRDEDKKSQYINKDTINRSYSHSKVLKYRFIGIILFTITMLLPTYYVFFYKNKILTEVNQSGTLKEKVNLSDLDNFFLDINNKISFSKIITPFRNHSVDYKSAWKEYILDNRIKEKAYQTNSLIEEFSLLNIQSKSHFEYLNSNFPLGIVSWSSLTSLDIPTLVVWDEVEPIARCKYKPSHFDIDKYDFKLDIDKVIKKANKFISTPEQRAVDKEFYRNILFLLLVNTLSKNTNDDLGCQQLHEISEQMLLRKNLALTHKEFNLLVNVAAILDIRLLLPKIRRASSLYLFNAYIEEAYRDLGYISLIDKAPLIKKINSIVLEKKSIPFIFFKEKGKYYSKVNYNSTVSHAYMKFIGVSESVDKYSPELSKLLRLYFAKNLDFYISNYVRYNLSLIYKVDSFYSNYDYNSVKKLQLVLKTGNFQKKLSYVIDNLSLFAENKNILEDIKSLKILKKNIDGYKQIVSQEVRYLEKASLSNEHIERGYKTNQQRLIEEFDKYSKEIKLNKNVKELIYSPIKNYERIYIDIIKHRVDSYWVMNVKWIYQELYDFFPFTIESKKNMKINYLIELLGNNGVYVEKIKQIKPELNFLKNIGEISGLEYSEQYFRIENLRSYFFQRSGKLKPLELSIKTHGPLISEFVKNSNSSDINVYYSKLDINNDSLYGFGVDHIYSKFKLDWWHANVAKIELLDSNYNQEKSISFNENWSIFRLLSVAKVNEQKHIYSWVFGENMRSSYLVSFEAPLLLTKEEVNEAE